MNHNRPRVSIGMPVYNGDDYIDAAIGSILAQSYTDFELIISDNASHDRTREICERYAASDPRVRYSRTEKNIGAMRNFNRVFELSSGEYFKWAAHDDLLAPDFLRQCVAVLDREPSVVLCYTSTQVIDEQGNFERDYPYNGQYRADSWLPHERFGQLIDFSHWCIQDFGLIRASALRKTRLYGSYTASDRVLLARLGLLGRFHEIEQPLFQYRRHAQQSIAMVDRGPSLLLYAIWNDPANANRILLPIWRLYGELFKAVHETPINLYNAIACYLTLLAWPWHNRQAQRMVKDIIIAAALQYARYTAQRASAKQARKTG